MTEKITISIKQLILFLVLILIAFTFQVIPGYNIAFNVYKWHFAQPETYQGIIEIMMIFFSLSVIGILFNKYKVFFLFIIILYLQSHQVLVPLTLAILYFEIIFLIGNAFYLFFNQKENHLIYNRFKYFIAGIAIWSFFAIICSLFGLGNFMHLRILTIILGLLSLIYVLINEKIYKPFSFKLIEQIDLLDKLERILFHLISLVVLIQLAKTNSAFDYDSIWYGLRPEKVLIGENSFFDNLKMVDFVYVYPKLFELFIIPISNLGQFSFINTANITFFILLLLIIYYLIRSFELTKKDSLLITLLISTLPVLSNMASTAKSDIFTTFLLILGMYHIVSWLKKPDNSHDLFLGFASFILSFGGKLTSFAYVPFIILGLIISVLIIIVNKKVSLSWSKIKSYFCSSKDNITLLCISFFVIVGVSYRTYLITGFPFYPIFGNLFARVGFTTRYPFLIKNSEGDYKFNGLLDFINRWYHLFFDPKSYPHVIMLWVGNLAGYLIILIGILMITNKINYKGNISVVSFFIPILFIGAFFASTFPEGGDANYYLPPLIVGIILLSVILFKKIKIQKLLITLSLIIFLPLQMGLMMVSHPSWNWGTGKINLNLFKPMNSTQNYKKNVFNFNGLNEIETYLENQQSFGRCIGFGPEQVLNLLSCRFEDIPHLASSHLGNQTIVENEESLRSFMKWAEVRYIIMPKEKIQGFQPTLSLIAKFESDPHVIKVLSAKYYLLDLKGINY